MPGCMARPSRLIALIKLPPLGVIRSGAEKPDEQALLRYSNCQS